MDLRLFFALPLPLPAARRLCDTLRRKTSQPIRWVLPEQQHVTVHFLGSVEEEQLPELCRKAEALCQQHQPFTLLLDHLTYVPSAQSPSMIWLRGQPSESFNQLAWSFRRRFPTGENRTPLPHVTLARLKGFRQPPVTLPRINALSLAVHSVELWQSFTLPEGARYQRLHRWPLNSGR
ncbi:MAG: RNA 2',3'-cyclic phosphodiesterase [Chitinophagales bacterium]|nr:RNA 2',3'-cyclic phosphodiesterase [Chitinophagales bacterium]MDW8394153.1 RNA 2',3'-cyclic phosphodiesterase [Chitinophagales bacterium]